MRSWRDGRALMALAAAMCGPCLAVRAASGPGAEAPFRVEWVKVRVRHAHFPKYGETHRVKLEEPFPISDLPLSARVVEFVPDFGMDKDTGAVRTRSLKCNNPAVRIVVKDQQGKETTHWAFRSGTRMHPSAQTLYFELVKYKVRFESRKKTGTGRPQ